MTLGNRRIKIIIFLIALASLTNKCFASPTTTPVVLTTTLGDVTGFRQMTSAATVETFYRIPFAQPPVGQLRFKPPVAAQPWAEIRSGTEKPNSCWQSMDTTFGDFKGSTMWNPNTLMSEDCLYLNVWRPKCSFNCEAKAILVWIYGGGFYSGTTTLDVYDGTQLAARNDVIVVSIAYRVGALGFLYLGNENAPGNVGMLDQVMALQWVKDNAANLGGSPNDITIFGESAGAASVGFHLLSPLSKDLFNYAIMQSASPLASWGIQSLEKATNRSNQLLTLLNCNVPNVTESLNCLLEASPEQIIDKQWSIVGTYILLDALFGPIVDGYFLPDTPEFIISQGKGKNTSILIGVNKNEGYYFDVYAFSNEFPLHSDGQINEAQYQNILEQLFSKDFSLIQNLQQEYPIVSNTSFSSNVDAISGDMLFKCPVVDFAQMYSQLGNPVYMYSFEHRTSATPWPEWMGVLHGYEIEMIFGAPFVPGSNYTEAEKQLSSTMMKLWTDFSKTGNPNSLNETIWPAYKPNEEAFITIDLDGTRINHKLRSQQCVVMETVKCKSFKLHIFDSGELRSRENNFTRLLVTLFQYTASRPFISRVLRIYKKYGADDRVISHDLT